jgi:hypothetical protein
MSVRPTIRDSVSGAFVIGRTAYARVHDTVSRDVFMIHEAITTR